MQWYYHDQHRGIHRYGQILTCVARLITISGMSRPTIDLRLFRHAHAALNDNPAVYGGRQNESPLTKGGRDQARILGSFIAKLGVWPDCVFTTKAVRGIETADISLAAASQRTS